MNKIFGHDAQRDELLEAAHGERMHHAWLLTGPKGIGKASLARDLALRLLAGQSAPVCLDHQARHLVMAGSHPDYAELTRLMKDNGDLARNISVDQVRALHRILDTAPSMAPRRIILIDSADDMERSAANALLKSLEEPPANTVFLLISHGPSRLLPTLRSRCRVLRFHPLSDHDMARAISAHDPACSSQVLASALAVGKGIPADAIDLGGLNLDDLYASLKKIYETGDENNALRIALSQRLSVKAARERYGAFLSLTPAFLHDTARSLPAHSLGPVIAAWEQARELASTALPLSLDPAATVFELGTLVASLSVKYKMDNVA